MRVVLSVSSPALVLYGGLSSECNLEFTGLTHNF
jgi:hypothetical protein